MTDIDPDQTYRVSAAFFAELAGHGVGHVVISPGSRSTPLTITAHRTEGMISHVLLDERVAGFFALGLARATGAPVALVCTSGTAAANYLPAVIEAHHSRVPLIVCTADRPPELRDRGAAQTIDQVGLYGSHVRWFADLPVASDADAAFGRRIAARAASTATGRHPGPVHLNWPLREPLTPRTWTASREQPAAIVAIDRPVDPGPGPDLAGHVAASNGIIVVGPGDLAASGEDIGRLAAQLGWPVLAEATSSLRTGSHVVDRPFLQHWDLLLGHAGWGGEHVPAVVIRFGGPPTSKALRLWLERHRPEVVVVDRAARFEDPSDLVTRMVITEIGPAVEALLAGRGAAGEWERRWVEADRRLADLVDRVLDDGPLLEAGIVRALDRALPAGSAMVVSNSMPVRDVDGYLPVTSRPLRVMANRGAAGIDGVTSTALGVAASGITTALLTGDVALTHDLGGLHAGLRAGLDLTVVVPDNGGGGIFEFLPVAHHTDVDFEQLFITPSDVDWEGLAALRGLRFREVTTASELADVVAGALGRSGIDLIRVRVDRAANVAQHRALAALVDELVP
ncbi:MAG: 2-succinyl-5-enolpyruvyl-6-hydroxy-3-cyclohexene-1-carboxylic-acid synthase [Acidimicrobiia bacterium]|nr:2-succinyl-5-enolpyruvyl-6-hydroxy-3-cyclohexene-1-carboxylic-acid synthase [Acidimicrobiia bacterium]